MKTLIAFAACICMQFHAFAQAEDDLQKTMRGMDAAGKKFSEGKRTKVVALMSLEVMFPDPSVRALAKAAGEGDIDGINRLVKQGVSVNAKGAQDATPLYWAINNYNGFTNLLGLGADPNAVFGNGVGGSVMGRALTVKDTRFLKALLEHAGNPNLRDNIWGTTPLFGVLTAKSEAADLLLKAGADINARDKWGNTPVMAAAATARFEVVYQLLQRGADCQVTNKVGETLASRVGSLRFAMDPKQEPAKWMEKVVEWLQKAGIEIPAKPADKR